MKAESLQTSNKEGPMSYEYIDVYKMWAQEVARHERNVKYPHQEYDAVACLADPDKVETIVVPICSNGSKPRHFMTKCRHGLVFMYYLRDCCREMFEPDVVKAVSTADAHVRAIRRRLGHKFFVLRYVLNDIVFYFSDAFNMLDQFKLQRNVLVRGSDGVTKPAHEEYLRSLIRAFGRCLFPGLCKVYSFAAKYGRRHLIRALGRRPDSITDLFETQSEHPMQIYGCALCGSRRVACVRCPNRIRTKHRCKRGSGELSDLELIGEARQWIWYVHAKNVLRKSGVVLGEALSLIWSAYGTSPDFMIALKTLENMVSFYVKRDAIIPVTLGPIRIAYVHH